MPPVKSFHEVNIMHPFIEKQLLPLREHGTCKAVFIGDSVTHGVFECRADKSPVFDLDAVYHNRFRLRFANGLGSGDDALDYELQQKPINIVNSGINGDSAAGGWRRFNRDVLQHRPDLCVVNFGLNDVHGDFDRYVTHMNLIFEMLKNSGIPAVFCTCNMMNTYVIEEMIPNPDYRAGAYKTAEMQKSGKLRRYIEAAMEVADANGALIADTNAAWMKMEAEGKDTTLMLANGINHPTRELHELFVDEIVKALLKA